MKAVQAPPEEQATTHPEIGEQPSLEQIKELVNSSDSSSQQQNKVEQLEQETKKPTLAEMKEMVGIASSKVDTQSAETVEATQADCLQPTAPQTDASKGVETLVDEDDFISDEALATKRNVWQNPWMKVSLVGGGIGVACLLVAAILQSFGKTTLSANEAQTTEAVAIVEDSDNIAQQQGAEIARLKTSNALGNQASVINSQPTQRTEIRPAARPAARVSDPAQITQRQSQTAAQAKSPTPQSQTQRPRPVAVARPAATPTPRPTPTPRAITTAAISPAVAASSLQPNVVEADVDPYQEQQRLTAAGSYGQVTTTAVANGSSEVSTEIITTEAETPDAIPVLVSNALADKQSETTSSNEVTDSYRPLPKAMEAADAHYQEVSYESIPEAISIESLEVPTEVTSYEQGVEFIMRNSEAATSSQETIILPGSSAAGQVIAPVAVAQGIQSTVGAIELTTDLVSNSGVIMPAGTQLTVELSGMSNSGMMQLIATAIVLPRSGYEHMQIPPEAISIQGANGQVLMAKDIFGADSELRRLERNQALLGALSTVGSILNRPSGSISTVTVGGASSSTTYDSPNLLGAVLEGGANTLIAQRTAQNQQRAAELQQRPSVWVLEQGTPIEVFINQPIAIGG